MQPSTQPLQIKSSEELAFVRVELQQQREDDNRHQEFIPLAELQADMKMFPKDKRYTSELLEQMKRLSETWDLIVQDGAPIGVELMNSAGQYAAILPEANGGFRIQYFGEQGFTNHQSTGRSPHEAFEKALLEGYSDLQPGIMEFLSNSPSWKSEAKDIDIQYLDVSQITSNPLPKTARTVFAA